jgi:hypothetical protein
MIIYVVYCALRFVNCLQLLESFCRNAILLSDLSSCEFDCLAVELVCQSHSSCFHSLNSKNLFLFSFEWVRFEDTCRHQEEGSHSTRRSSSSRTDGAHSLVAHSLCSAEPTDGTTLISWLSMRKCSKSIHMTS